MRTEATPPGGGALHITLAATPAGVGRFLPLLGEGVIVRGPAGLSVESFLCREAGVPADYLRDRVQTVFLDGKAVDDLTAVRVGDRSVLALSAAMPGLAGAVLRRGGFYAAMRRQISHTAPATVRKTETAAVTLKLFNLVAKELGPALLERGASIPCRQLKDFLLRQGRWVWAGCRAAEVEGLPVAAAQVAETLPDEGTAVLVIRPE
jgi:hypothetical protein